MTESSNTCDTHGSSDPRNCVGFAINEIYAGNRASNGDFVDLVLHRPDQNQTATYVSSIDPWHSAADLVEDHDQTGFDLFYTSGITNHLPAMIPVAMLYGTPKDAAAEIAYVENAAIRSRTSRWAKSLTARTCCPRTMARSICSLPLRFTRSIRGSNLAVRYLKASTKTLKSGRTRRDAPPGSAASSTI